MFMRIRSVRPRNHVFDLLHRLFEKVHRLWPFKIQSCLPCFKEVSVGKFQVFAEFGIFLAALGLCQLEEMFVQYGGIELAAVFEDEGERAAEKWGTQEGGDALAVVIAESVDADFAPGFSVEG